MQRLPLVDIYSAACFTDASCFCFSSFEIGAATVELITKLHAFLTRPSTIPGTWRHVILYLGPRYYIPDQLRQAYFLVDVTKHQCVAIRIVLHKKEASEFISSINLIPRKTLSSCRDQTLVIVCAIFYSIQTRLEPKHGLFTYIAFTKFGRCHE